MKGIRYRYKKIGTLFFVVAFLGFSKVPMDPCLKEVDAIFKVMYTNLPQNGKIVFVNYEIITHLRPSKEDKEQIKKSEIKTYTSNKQYQFISEDISVYRDEDNTFTIIPSKKMIYWSESIKAAKKENRMEEVKKLQDTIFSSYEKVECQIIKNDPKATKLIRLIPNKNWADRMQIEDVEYYIHSEKKEMIRQIINYRKTKKMKSVEYQFKTVNYDYKNIDLNTPVKNLFINSKSKLVPAYGDYQLIDVRKKKKN